MNHLAPGRVDVWLTALGGLGRDAIGAFERLLSAAERERWLRYRVEEARLQYLVGRALVRTSLSRYAEVAPEAWEFAANRYGCPFVAEPASRRDLRFNLSHTDGLVACAVGRDCELGVDVESTERRLDVMELAPSVFAPAEVANLVEAAPEERRDLFFCYWTLKEAYIKARGMGISLALDGFAFDLGGAAPRVRFSEKCPDAAARWRFRQYVPTPRHKLALAAAAPGAPELDIRIAWVTPLPGAATVL
ncbi:MAG TPA: 4'-phosphopantetheinyl transferase superfamily protein [Stellaceae bacterium]|nr:4'-phosphopantetheinyl transferase superfamily protein [Stellaceae bacterium]